MPGLQSQVVRGTGSRVALPAYSRKVDWEAEIAVVMGRECRNVSVEQALEYVAGLTIANRLSATRSPQARWHRRGLAVQIRLGQPEML